jgi:hypothetical protein
LPTALARAALEVGFVPGSHPGLMALQMEPGGGAGTVITTDSNGVATANHMGGKSVSCYYATGPFTIVVNAAGSTSATFSPTVSS